MNPASQAVPFGFYPLGGEPQMRALLRNPRGYWMRCCRAPYAGFVAGFAAHPARST